MSIRQQMVRPLGRLHLSRPSKKVRQAYSFRSQAISFAKPPDTCFLLCVNAILLQASLRSRPMHAFSCPSRRLKTCATGRTDILPVQDCQRARSPLSRWCKSNDGFGSTSYASSSVATIPFRTEVSRKKQAFLLSTDSSSKFFV